mmetsp:Transcript_750/g.2044  ORF Transcript_750/g.2044 Transcript_750/m.2044 type:complete len:478 (-) Transcript_750:2714-4147(-)
MERLQPQVRRRPAAARAGGGPAGGVRGQALQRLRRCGAAAAGDEALQLGALRGCRGAPRLRARRVVRMVQVRGEGHVWREHQADAEVPLARGGHPRRLRRQPLRPGAGAGGALRGGAGRLSRPGGRRRPSGRGGGLPAVRVDPVDAVRQDLRQRADHAHAQGGGPRQRRRQAVRRRDAPDHGLQRAPLQRGLGGPRLPAVDLGGLVRLLRAVRRGRREPRSIGARTRAGGGPGLQRRAGGGSALPARRELHQAGLRLERVVSVGRVHQDVRRGAPQPLSQRQGAPSLGRQGLRVAWQRQRGGGLRERAVRDRGVRRRGVGQLGELGRLLQVLRKRHPVAPPQGSARGLAVRQERRGPGRGGAGLRGGPVRGRPGLRTQHVDGVVRLLHQLRRRTVAHPQDLRPRQRRGQVLRRRRQGRRQGCRRRLAGGPLLQQPRGPPGAGKRPRLRGHHPGVRLRREGRLRRGLLVRLGRMHQDV